MWSVNGTTGGSQTVGTISPTGLYTAPANAPSPNTVTVTAMSQQDSSQSANGTVTITSQSGVSVSPINASLTAGQSQQFTATVTATSSTAVTWSVNGVVGGSSTTGTISNSGLYTAPNAVTAGNGVNITATSQADPTLSGTAVASFLAASGSTPPGGLTSLPPNQALGYNQVTNSGFESGNTGWTLGCGFSIDTSTSYDGTSSLAFLPGSTCSYPDVSSSNTVRGTGAARSYTLQAWVKGTSGTDITVKLAIHDVARGGDIVGETSVVTPSSSWQLISQNDIDLLPLLDGDTLAVQPVVMGGTTGKVWFDDVELIEQLQPPVSAFLLYPNYKGYLWSDKSQTIRLEVEVPRPSGMTVQAVLESAAGMAISTVTQPASATQELDFDGTALGPGSYFIRTNLLNASNQTVASYPAYMITKVTPAFRSSLVNWFDTDNFLVRNGQKVFVWGAYDRWGANRCNQCLFTSETGYLDIPGFNSLSTLESYQDTMLNAEMNILPFVSVNVSSTDNQLTPWLQALNSAGVGHIQITNSYLNGQKPVWASAEGLSDPELWQLLAGVMNGNPGALGYYPYDEPDPSLMPAVFQQTQALSALDPGDVTFGTLDNFAQVFRWRDVSDVLSSNPYPVGQGLTVYATYHGATTTPAMVSTNIATSAVVQQVYGSRPVWMVLQLFDLNSQFPTYEQMKQQAYNAIISGANGILWWGFVNQQGLEYEWYVAGNHQPYLDFKQISGEVMGLAPFLISPSQPSLLQPVSNANIQYLVKSSSSEIVIFASNTSQNAAGSVTFTLPSSVSATGSTVQVYSENRTVPLSGNTFTDTFNGYDVHVYIVSLH